jgi:LuxR family maltose regulon positive regulatory protein
MLPSDAGAFPRARRDLNRERLLQSVIGAQQRICIVQAPAGYGKSTLLQQMAEELGRREMACRWLTDANVESRRDAGGSGSASADDPPHFSLIDNPPSSADNEAQRAIALIEAADPRTRIVIATRQPRVGAAITARFLGFTASYTANDLALNPEEIADLFRGRLSTEALAQAFEWSQGWALGLALIESDLLHSESTPIRELDLEEPTERVNAYFAGRVLAEIDAPLREFLLACGDFAELNLEIISETTPYQNACVLLELAYDRGFFLDYRPGGSTGYRFLPRFRAFLEDFRAAHGQMPPASFHRMLASRFEAAGAGRAALHHAFRSGDREELAALLDRLEPFRLVWSQTGATSMYVRAVPESIARRYPMLLLARIFLLHASGAPYLARDLLTKFLRVDAPTAGAKAALYARILELVSRIHEDRAPDIAEVQTVEQEFGPVAANDPVALCVLYRLASVARYEDGDIQEALLLSERAHQVAIEENLPFLAAFANAQRGLTRLKMGDLPGADEVLSQARQVSMDLFGLSNPQAALLGAVLARVRVEQLDLGAARKLLEAHLPQIELRPAWLFNSAEAIFTAAAFVCYETDGADATLEYLYRKREIFRIRGLLIGDATLAMLQVRALFRAGRIVEARALLDDDPLRSALDSQEGPGRLSLSLLANILLCHELVSSQEEAPGSSRMSELENLVRRAHDVVLEVSCRIGAALHELRSGDMQRASATMFHAVRLSARFNIARPLYENWRYLLPLIGQKDLSFLSHHEVEFLQSIRGLAAQTRASESDAGDDLGLSPRERQILLLLADGCSSKEMARSLNISMGTIKGYRRTLYEKLHIFTRSEAVAAARRLSSGGRSAPKAS